jgi:hypothetical protein
MQTKVILAFLVLACIAYVTAIKKPPATQVPGCDPYCRPGTVCCADGKVHRLSGSVDFGGSDAVVLSRKILARRALSRKSMSRKVQNKACDNFCKVGNICCATGTLVKAI